MRVLTIAELVRRGSDEIGRACGLKVGGKMKLKKLLASANAGAPGAQPLFSIGDRVSAMWTDKKLHDAVFLPLLYSYLSSRTSLCLAVSYVFLYSNIYLQKSIHL
jgi:hypothetical protein